MIFWAILTAAFLVIEVVVPALVSIWFALAALIMIFVSVGVDNIYLQLLIFAILSLLFILSLRPYCKKYVKPKDILRKEEVKIISVYEIDSQRYGYDVKYKGGVWTAISSNQYQVGDIKDIEGFDGNKIKI